MFFQNERRISLPDIGKTLGQSGEGVQWGEETPENESLNVTVGDYLWC